MSRGLLDWGLVDLTMLKLFNDVGHFSNHRGSRQICLFCSPDTDNCPEIPFCGVGNDSGEWQTGKTREKSAVMKNRPFSCWISAKSFISGKENSMQPMFCGASKGNIFRTAGACAFVLRKCDNWLEGVVKNSQNTSSHFFWRCSRWREKCGWKETHENFFRCKMSGFLSGTASLLGKKQEQGKTEGFHLLTRPFSHVAIPDPRIHFIDKRNLLFAMSCTRTAAQENGSKHSGRESLRIANYCQRRQLVINLRISSSELWLINCSIPEGLQVLVWH